MSEEETKQPESLEDPSPGGASPDGASPRPAGPNATAAGQPVRDSVWIQSILPHRYPFLLVDRVLEIVPEKRIVAIKNVTVNEEFFVGHFPGQPVMPGVLIIEGMAQAAGILSMSQREDRDRVLLLFMGIDRARFRRPVVPGDQIRYEIEVQRLRRSFCKVDARALVDGRLVAEATLSSGTVER